MHTARWGAQRGENAGLQDLPGGEVARLCCEMTSVGSRPAGEPGTADSRACTSEFHVASEALCVRSRESTEQRWWILKNITR